MVIEGPSDFLQYLKQTCALKYGRKKIGVWKKGSDIGRLLGVCGGKHAHTFTDLLYQVGNSPFDLITSYANDGVEVFVFQADVNGEVSYQGGGLIAREHTKVQIVPSDKPNEEEVAWHQFEEKSPARRKKRRESNASESTDVTNTIVGYVSAISSKFFSDEEAKKEEEKYEAEEPPWENSLAQDMRKRRRRRSSGYDRNLKYGEPTVRRTSRHMGYEPKFREYHASHYGEQVYSHNTSEDLQHRPFQRRRRSSV